MQKNKIDKIQSKEHKTNENNSKNIYKLRVMITEIIVDMMSKMIKLDLQFKRASLKMCDQKISGQTTQ